MEQQWTPPPDQLNYFNFLFSVGDPGRIGVLNGGSAVIFLRRSGLPDAMLRTIWELADSKKLGFLSLSDFYIAMRLVSLAQSGQYVSMETLVATRLTPLPPPRMAVGDIQQQVPYPHVHSATYSSTMTPSIAAPPMTMLPASVLPPPAPEEDEFGGFEAAPLTMTAPAVTPSAAPYPPATNTPIQHGEFCSAPQAEEDEFGGFEEAESISKVLPSPLPPSAAWVQTVALEADDPFGDFSTASAPPSFPTTASTATHGKSEPGLGIAVSDQGAADDITNDLMSAAEGTQNISTNGSNAVVSLDAQDAGDGLMEWGGLSAETTTPAEGAQAETAAAAPSEDLVSKLMAENLFSVGSNQKKASNASPSLLFLQQAGNQPSSGASFDDWSPMVAAPMAAFSGAGGDKMSAIDALAEMDLAAAEEEWDEFTDETTEAEHAPSVSTLAAAGPSLANQSAPVSAVESGGEGDGEDWGELFVSSEETAAQQPDAFGNFEETPKPEPQDDAFGDFEETPKPEPQDDAFGDFEETPKPEPQDDAFGDFEETPKPEPQDDAFGDFEAHDDPPENKDQLKSITGVHKGTNEGVTPDGAVASVDMAGDGGCTEDGWGDFGDAASTAAAAVPANTKPRNNHAPASSLSPDPFPPTPPEATDTDNGVNWDKTSEGGGGSGLTEWGAPVTATVEPETGETASSQQVVEEDPFASLHDATPPAALPSPAALKGSETDGASCPLPELLDLLVSCELFDLAAHLATHLEELAELRGLKSAKAAAAEEDRFEDAARMRDQINATAASIEDTEKIVISWRSAAVAANASRVVASSSSSSSLSSSQGKGGGLLARMCEDVERQVGAEAAKAFEEVCVVGQPSLSDQARGGDLARARARLAAAKRRATLLIALHSTHAHQLEVWRQVLAVVRQHAEVLLTALSAVAALGEEEASAVCNDARFATFVRGAAQVLWVGLLVCACAEDLAMTDHHHGGSGEHGAIKADLGLRGDEIQMWVSSAAEKVLSMTGGDAGGLAACLVTLVEESPSASSLQATGECADLCGLSWFPVSPGESAVVYGQVSCIAACGNLFANLVAGKGGALVSLKPVPASLH